MVIINDTTLNKGYLKPNSANLLTDDVARLRSALDAVDVDVKARETAQAGTDANVTTVTNAQSATAANLTALTNSLVPNVIAVSLGATTNNWAPTGLATADIIEINPTASIGITGIVAPSSARRIQIHNVGTGVLLWLSSENVNSTAVNRLFLPSDLPAFLMPDDTITLRYSLSKARWVVADWATKGDGMGLDWFEDYVVNSPVFTAAYTGGLSSDLNGYSTGLNNDRAPVGAMQVYGTASIAEASGAKGLGIPSGANFLGVWRVCLPLALTAVDNFYAAVGFKAKDVANTFIYWWADGAKSTIRWSTYYGPQALPQQDSALGLPLSTGWVWLAIFSNAAKTRIDFMSSTNGKDWAVLPKTTSIPSPLHGYSFVEVVAQFGAAQGAIALDFSGYRVGVPPLLVR